MTTPHFTPGSLRGLRLGSNIAVAILQGPLNVGLGHAHRECERRAQNAMEAGRDVAAMRLSALSIAMLVLQSVANVDSPERERELADIVRGMLRDFRADDDCPPKYFAHIASSLATLPIVMDVLRTLTASTLVLPLLEDQLAHATTDEERAEAERALAEHKAELAAADARSDAMQQGLALSKLFADLGATVAGDEDDAR